MNLPIGLSLADKIKLLRKQERLSQQAFADLVGVKASTIAMFESGAQKTLASDTIQAIANHPRFMPYVVWLIVDQLTEEQQDQALAILKELQAEQDAAAPPPDTHS